MYAHTSSPLFSLDTTSKIADYEAGMKSLSDGINAYVAGGNQLAGGVQSYVTGTTTLTDGMQQYIAGVNQKRLLYKPSCCH